MTLRRKILAGIAVLAVAIQFVRPARNESAGPFPDDILAHEEAPQAVKDILTQHCYDCHSDNTRYPWYTNVQPVGWWMASHVSEGREHLNFAEFATYDAKKAAHKMEELVEHVEEREMPLPSYTIIHRDARLTDAQIQAVADWARALEAKFKTLAGSLSEQPPEN